ncbi:MAG: zinc ribbon domain-containing protein [Clostridia bacterium]|nr:zinc ribbon domain-containing protein [Clostridia bacterium]
MKAKKQTAVCRVCGEPIPLSDRRVLVCPACGASQLSLPGAPEEEQTHIADACRYLSRGDFYSALRLFEAIDKTDPTPLSQCGKLLARYGVTGARGPAGEGKEEVCLRLTMTDVRSDPDFLAARRGADPEERAFLDALAARIEKEEARLKLRETKEKREREDREENGYSEEYLAALKREEERKAREKRLREEKEAEENKKEEEKARRIIRARRRELIASVLKILLPAAAVCLALLLAGVLYFRPLARYRKAEAELEAGHYASAARLLRELGDFKDAKELLDPYRFYGLEAGDVVSFGTYPQETNGTKTPIEWIVLGEEEGNVLLLSRRILDVKKYNETHISVTWETCSLRAWLGGEFLKTAFSAQDRERLVETVRTTADNTAQGTLGGAPTADTVFCLSAEEAKRYFGEAVSGSASATPYAVAKSIYQDDEPGSDACWYWLRTPGSSQSNAARVDFDGSVNLRGAMVDYSKYGVRPAIVVQIAEYPSE